MGPIHLGLSIMCPKLSSNVYPYFQKIPTKSYFYSCFIADNEEQLQLEMAITGREGKLPDNVNMLDNPAVKPSEVGEFKDFGDMFTMEDVIEGWSVDTVGVRDLTVEAEC